MDFLLYRAQSGVAIIREFHEAIGSSSVEEFARTYGFRLAEVKKIMHAWQIFGPRAVYRSASEAQLSLTVVLDLSRIVWPLRHRKDRTKLLVTLCDLLAGVDADQAKDIASQKVQEWLIDTTKRGDTACFHQTVGRDGKRRLTAAFATHTAARMDTILHRLANRLMHNETELTYDQAYALALYQKVTGNGETGEQFGPMFMIATDYRFHADGRITTTDGALIDLKDVVNTEIAPTGWAAVMGDTEDSVIPTVGALVKVERRLASEPQRLVAVMESLRCVWPGCDMPAAKCQVHHVQAHHFGGKTEQQNLGALCKHHNGRNDDDPDAETVNGRIERDPDTGKLGLRRYKDAPLWFNSHLLAAKTTHAYATFHYQR